MRGEDKNKLNSIDINGKSNIIMQDIVNKGNIINISNISDFIKYEQVVNTIIEKREEESIANQIAMLSDIYNKLHSHRVSNSLKEKVDNAIMSLDITYAKELVENAHANYLEDIKSIKLDVADFENCVKVFTKNRLTTFEEFVNRIENLTPTKIGYAYFNANDYNYLDNSIIFRIESFSRDIVEIVDEKVFFGLFDGKAKSKKTIHRFQVYGCFYTEHENSISLYDKIQLSKEKKCEADGPKVINKIPIDRDFLTKFLKEGENDELTNRMEVYASFRIDREYIEEANTPWPNNLIKIDDIYLEYHPIKYKIFLKKCEDFPVSGMSRFFDLGLTLGKVDEFERTGVYEYSKRDILNNGTLWYNNYISGSYFNKENVDYEKLSVMRQIQVLNIITPYFKYINPIKDQNFQRAGYLLDFRRYEDKVIDIKPLSLDPELRALGLVNIRSNLDMNDIYRFNNLIHLYISFTESSDVRFPDLKHFNNLKGVLLDVPDSALPHILERLPDSIKILEIRSSSFSNFKLIHKFKNLLHIDVSGTSVTTFGDYYNTNDIELHIFALDTPIAKDENGFMMSIGWNQSNISYVKRHPKNKGKVKIFI